MHYHGAGVPAKKQNISGLPKVMDTTRKPMQNPLLQHCIQLFDHFVTTSARAFSGLMQYAYMHPDIEFHAAISAGEFRQKWRLVTQTFGMGETDGPCT
jgi:hypothetical protein